ncbi:MAG TPA: ABC transporter substrate-binding protein [Stellaceae bacterium]|nr:ABC transporter substrate-binding protein [Stellaceae bacterium]
MRFGLCLIALLSLVFASATPRVQAAEKVTVGYTPGPDYLAAFTAKDQGFFEKHGIDATLQFTASANPIPAALLSDSLQIGTPTVSILLAAASSGLGLKIIGANIETGGSFHLSAVMVRNDEQLSSAKDLEGKTVAVPGFNSFLHMLFVKWLQNHGADPAKVHMVEIAIPGMMDAMKARQVDASLPVDPFMARIIGSSTGHVLSYYIDDFPPGILPTIYVATSDYVQKHPDVIKGFREARIEGLAYHEAHPEAAVESLAKHMNITPEIAKTLVMPRFITDVKPEQIKFWIDLMTEQKVLTAPIDPNSVIAQP